ncbi:MAG: type IV toxin-antitoxin system AbiEi family antitoxin domain-containing protein [Chloroflexi bacterium]|nr:type IV toxin-antitoxin system AbiEi family antitoxin domain-containing protein [Chloroflexota bacterium]
MDTPPDFHHLFRIAENQAGYFTARQAKEAGFSWERLSYYAAAGRLLRIRRGIYRLVQFPSSPYEDLFAAWLNTGPDSVISHESALYLYGLSDALPGEVHVIIPRTASRRRKMMHLHTNRIHPSEITRREGLPVTSPARTIVDVAAHGLAEEHIRQAVHAALAQGIAAKDELLSMAFRRGGRAGQIILRILEGQFP